MSKNTIDIDHLKEQSEKLRASMNFTRDMLEALEYIAESKKRDKTHQMVVQEVDHNLEKISHIRIKSASVAKQTMDNLANAQLIACLTAIESLADTCNNVLNEGLSKMKDK